MRLRRVIVPLHRDLGYFFAGLTVLYALSGIAVNHIDHWNPSYRKESVERQVGALLPGSPAEVAGEALRRLGMTESPSAVVPAADGTVQIFLPGRKLVAHPLEGRVVEEVTTPRAVWYQLNFLHLNRGKGWWTWFADLYAVGLVVLAVTGVFIIPGKKGLAGRGRWLLGLGFAIPLLYMLLAT